MSTDERMVEQHVARFDHFDPDVTRDPHRVYEVMRDRCPIARSDAHGGFWVVTRYEDLQRVARDWETFSSENPLIARAQMAPLEPGQKRLDATFLTMDPPDHEKFRGPVQPWFSPATIWKLEPQIRASAQRLIRGFVSGGRADLSYDYARPLAKETIAQHFGLTAEQMDRFETHSYNSMALEPAVSDAGHAGVADLLAELIEDRRRAHTGDVLSALLDMTVDDRPLTEEEISRTAFVLLAAGFETTMNTISTSLWYLAQHPQVRRELRAEPEISPLAVEEFIRLFAPLSSARTATRDAEVGGQAIRAGERLLLAFPSGNRDKSDFDHPNSLVLDREANRHLAFGYGVHRCIGLHLARLEIRIALEELLKAVPDFSLDPEREVGWTFGKTQAWGPTTLSVLFQTAPS